MQSVSNAVNISEAGTVEVMEFLADGHGYQWRRLGSELVVTGSSTRPVLPDLLLIDKNLLVWDGDTDFDRRLKHTIQLLSGEGGKSHG